MAETKTAKETIVNLRIPVQLLEKIDSVVKGRPLPTSRHAWIMEALYRQVRHEAIEGRVQISKESNVGPRFSVGFLPYLDAEYGGALRTISIVGRDAPEKYLRGLGLNLDDAKNRAKILNVEKTISIDHVVMPTSRLGPFGFGSVHVP